MYIRTKDGVYDLENDDIVKIDGKYKKCYVEEDSGDTCFKDIEAIKVSENLEELCDEFVIDNPNDWNDIKKPFVYQNIRKKLFEEASIEFRKDNNITVYGAIWTSKGLIYVAKMNQNGELVLI